MTTTAYITLASNFLYGEQYRCKEIIVVIVAEMPEVILWSITLLLGD